MSVICLQLWGSHMYRHGTVLLMAGSAVLPLLSLPQTGHGLSPHTLCFCFTTQGPMSGGRVGLDVRR